MDGEQKAQESGADRHSLPVSSRLPRDGYEGFGEKAGRMRFPSLARDFFKLTPIRGTGAGEASSPRWC